MTFFMRYNFNVEERHLQYNDTEVSLSAHRRSRPLQADSPWTIF